MHFKYVLAGRHRSFGVLVTHICTYLAAECWNRSENLANRKLSIFYIEVMYQVFSNSNQKIFFFGIKKNICKKNVRKKNSENFLKIENLDQEKTQIDQHFRFSENFQIFIFDQKYFLDFFLLSEKPNIFSELKKKLKYSFDVKN